MKKINQILAISAMVCVGMLLTSCSKDEKLANRLSGKWKGEWGMSYVDKDGVQHNSDYSVVWFRNDGMFETHGSGYQEDYYHEGPFTRLGFYFEWEIDHKTIYITYPGYAGYNCVIRDYEMKKKHFTGYIGNTHFDLDNLEKEYKWYDYAARYVATGTAVLLWLADDTYYYYDDYYYGTRSTSADMLDENGKPAGDMMPIRIYNRFADQ